MDNHVRFEQRKKSILWNLSKRRERVRYQTYCMIRKIFFIYIGCSERVIKALLLMTSGGVITH
jgi:hypothetical protein